MPPEDYDYSRFGMFGEHFDADEDDFDLIGEQHINDYDDNT